MAGIKSTGDCPPDVPPIVARLKSDMRLFIGASEQWINPRQTFWEFWAAGCGAQSQKRSNARLCDLLATAGSSASEILETDPPLPPATVEPFEKIENPYYLYREI